MNVFEPVKSEQTQGGLDGRLYCYGEYQGIKFIVDSDNEGDLEVFKNQLLDDIALRVAIQCDPPIERRFQATPAKPFNPVR